MTGRFSFPPSVWPPRIALDGHTLKFVHVSDQKLLFYVATDQWSVIIFNSLHDDDKMHIFQRLSDVEDSLSIAKMRHLANMTVAAISGTTHQAARRIAEHTVANWFSFDGWCITQGFDPYTQPLHRLITAGYRYMVELLDSNDKNALYKLVNKMWPPDESVSAVQEEHAIMASVIGAKPNSADGILR